jgi:hypothetical protein
LLLRKRGGLIITPTTKLSYLLITYIKSLKPESSRQEKISNQIFENLMMILMGPFFLILVFIGRVMVIRRISLLVLGIFSYIFLS